jgi:hypothetical protein
MAGSCEHGNELAGSIKGGEISGLAEWLWAFQNGFWSMELVIWVQCTITLYSNNTKTRRKLKVVVLWVIKPTFGGSGCYHLQNRSPHIKVTWSLLKMHRIVITSCIAWVTPAKKVKFSPWFNWAPRHEDVLGEWRYSSTHSLTLVLDGSEWPASRPGRFTPRERAPGTRWIGGWMGPRAILNAVVETPPGIET